jgi:hypothetical protein
MLISSLGPLIKPRPGTKSLAQIWYNIRDGQAEEFHAPLKTSVDFPPRGNGRTNPSGEFPYDIERKLGENP